MLPLKQLLLLVLVPIVVFFAVFRYFSMPRGPGSERSTGLPDSEASNSNVSHDQPLSSADYPRIYRMSSGWKAFNLIAGIGATWIGLTTLRSALAGPEVRA